MTLPIHRHRADDAGTPVNAYLVEGQDGVVAVDATLTVGGGRQLREHADAFGKPLRGVAITHAAAVHANVEQAMRAVLPTDELAFLMELSVGPVNGRAGARR